MVGVLVYREETGHRFDSEGCENRICPFEFAADRKFRPPNVRIFFRYIGRDWTILGRFDRWICVCSVWYITLKGIVRWYLDKCDTVEGSFICLMYILCFAGWYILALCAVKIIDKEKFISFFFWMMCCGWFYWKLCFQMKHRSEEDEKNTQ